MIKISFIGDIMCEKETLENYKQDDDYVFTEIFKDIELYLKKSDIVIGNLETPLGDEDYVNHKWLFNAPRSFIEPWKQYNVIFTTANNHCLDRNIKGIDETIRILDDSEILHTGTYRKKTDNRSLIYTINNEKIGVLSYTYGTNADFNKCYLSKEDEYKVNLFQPQEKSIDRKNVVKRILRKFRLIFNRIFKSDYYVLKSRKKLQEDISYCKSKGVKQIYLCLHVGGQYNLEPDSLTKTCIKMFSKLPFDAIICNHEHAVQKIDTKTFPMPIAYCLGNFLCHPLSVNTNKDPDSTISIIFNLYLDNNQIKNITISVIKSCLDGEGKIKVYLLSDMIKKEKDKRKKEMLTKQYKKAVYVACGYENISQITEEIEVINYGKR